MHPDVRKAFEQIDAAMFSGDTFHDVEARGMLNNYCRAWLAESRSIAEGEAEDAPVPTFGARELPSELAAQILTAETTREVKPPLNEGTKEFLCILTEELAESIQRVTKIERFGVASKNPWNGQDNLEGLEAELGDVVALMHCLDMVGFIDLRRVMLRAVRKLKAFQHEEDPTRPRLSECAHALLKVFGIGERIEALESDVPSAR